MVDSKPVKLKHEVLQSTQNQQLHQSCLFNPGVAPCRELLPPSRQRNAFQEFPTSLCRRGFHLARCGKAYGSWCRPRAGHRTGVAARAAPPPGCTDNCCQSLRSTSLELSVDNQFCRRINVECRTLTLRRIRTAFPSSPLVLQVPSATSVRRHFE